ncbi:MAG: iolG 4, partial [Candidatus Solibacter sp.]|nr:iolG 4 [Candidatus Solibacter sp.]
MPNRRSFLKSLTLPAAAAGFPEIVPASALGLDGSVPASDRITLASIGVGWMGGGHVDAFLKVDGAQYVAVADLDDEHAAENKAKIDKRYGNTDCKTYRAFEEVLSRKDIDAVSIAVPDHWHGIVAYCAARAGKDIYCEKPLAHNFAEGRAISDAVTKYKRIFQTGSWQRSTANFRQACELVRNGRIGKVTKVEVGLPGGWTDFAKTKDQDQITPPPAHIDYDRWMGPSQEMPFIMARFHKNWRWNLNTGG